MEKKYFNLVSINISDKKGIKKIPVKEAELITDFGIKGDAHTGKGERQISLLAGEDIDNFKNHKISIDNGDFAENLTTRGIDLIKLNIGTELFLDNVILKITVIGKECHNRCSIYKAMGDCIMPRKGVFAKVIRGGVISVESNCYYCV